jgi:hypothetical protein
MRPGHALVDVNGNAIEVGGHGGDYLGECKKAETISVKPSNTPRVDTVSYETVTELPRTGSQSALGLAVIVALFVGLSAELALSAKTTLFRKTV